MSLIMILLIAKVEGELVGCPELLFMNEVCSEESDAVLVGAVPSPDSLMEVEELTVATEVSESVIPLFSVVAAGMSFKEH